MNLNNVITWVIIIGVLASMFIFLALFVRKQVFIFILGLLLILGAIPVALLSEVAINFAAPPGTGHDGLGYMLGALLGVIGMLIMIFSKKLARPSQSQRRPS